MQVAWVRDRFPQGTPAFHPQASPSPNHGNRETNGPKAVGPLPCGCMMMTQMERCRDQRRRNLGRRGNTNVLERQLGFVPCPGQSPGSGSSPVHPRARRVTYRCALVMLCQSKPVARGCPKSQPRSVKCARVLAVRLLFLALFPVVRVVLVLPNPRIPQRFVAILLGQTVVLGGRILVLLATEPL